MAWPTDWDDRTGADGCAMCREGRSDRIPHGVRVWAGTCVDAYLSTQGAQPGYVIAIWRGRHVNDLTELSELSELTTYWSEVVRVSAAMQEHYRPRKVNYEVLGNQMPHLHTHLTARFAEGDVAPGAPLRGGRDLDLPTAVVGRDVAALSALLADAPSGTRQ